MKIGEMKGRASPYFIRVPPRLNGTGKYQTHYFKTRDEAETKRALWKQRDPDLHETLGVATTNQMRDLVYAQKLLDEAGKGYRLVDVVQYYLTAMSGPGKTLGEAIDDYIAEKPTITEKYAKNFRATKSRVRHLAERDLRSISLEDIMRVVGAIPNASRDQHLRHIRAAWNWARDLKGVNAKNPINSKLMGRWQRKGEPKLFSVEDAEKYLRGALEHELALLPYLVFGFFCGVRPEGEMTKLDWSAVDWERKHLNISFRVAKGGRRSRQLEIPENAIAWLEAYRAKGGSITGPIHSLSWKQTRDARYFLNRYAGREWIQDGMRRSFATYYYALTDDLSLTAARLGHTGHFIADRHYVAGRPKAEAERYFALRPDTPDNIVLMKTVAV